jgi:MATE family multidrug resistance protein
MMASILSGALMQFVDRTLLAHYSSLAMNSASFSQQLCNTLLLPLLCFASLSEVFVGQFNGAQLWKKTAAPVLQIAVFVCCLEALLVPFFLIFRKMAFPVSLYADGYPYLCISLITIPFQVWHSSLSAFFIGTQRPSIILYSVFSGNVANAFLDWLFIFGVPPVIPALGAAGAALATLVSSIISLFILSISFFGKKNAELYETRKFRIDREVLKKNIYLGFPYAFAVFIDMLTWVIVTQSLAKVSLKEVTLNSVCLGLWTFSFFVIEGLQKGVTSLASNCLGAGQFHQISKLIKSTAKVAVGISCFFYLLFQTFAPQILDVFFDIPNLKEFSYAQETLLVQWVSFAILSFSVGGLLGILNAGGDTRYATCVRILSFSTCVIVPALILKYTGGMRTIISWSLGLGSISATFLAYLLRYRSGRWNHNMIPPAYK